MAVNVRLDVNEAVGKEADESGEGALDEDEGSVEG